MRRLLTDGFPHEEPSPPEAAGVDGRALAEALARLRAMAGEGRFPGGQLAVRRGGLLLCNAAFGVARGHRPGEREHDAPVPVERTTRFCLFSAGKPLIALAVARLEERGRLDIDAPLARVMPEFDAPGKRDITTRDVLSHRGGILMRDFVRRPLAWPDWDEVRAALQQARPTHRRGTLAYHPFEYGWILAELVRRIDGRRLDAFIADEITGPAGLGGLTFGARDAELPSLARAYWLGGTTRIAGVPISRHFEDVNNDPRILTAFVPGAGLVGDAAHLAAFYQLLLDGGVAPNGARILDAATLARYTSRAYFGFCRSNRAPLAVGLGFLVGTRIPSIYGWWATEECFGHAGAFATVAFADRKTGLAVAIVTNGNRGAAEMVRRFTPLASLLRAACR